MPEKEPLGILGAGWVGLVTADYGVLFSAVRRPDWEREPADSDVFSVDVTSGRLTVVLRNGTAIGRLEMVFSPDRFASVNAVASSLSAPFGSPSCVQRRRPRRRSPASMPALFAAIHFYTQWFERLGANPLASNGSLMTAPRTGGGAPRAKRAPLPRCSCRWNGCFPNCPVR